MNRTGTALLAGLLMMGVSAIAFAQGYPVPAKTPETVVNCGNCGPNAGPGKTVGYEPPINAFTGRFLDSSYTSEWFDFRTARAYFCLIKPEINRIYFRYGNGSVAAYTLSTFFSRLESGEQLVFPVGTFSDRSGNPEVFLRWDEWFNPEFNTWTVVRADGSIRMPSFDVDDKGYVYVASTIFGWGIVKDGLSGSGSKMVSMFQRMSDGGPHIIAALKWNNRYYAYFDSLKPLWDVTNARTQGGVPTQVSVTVPMMPTTVSQFAKNAAADHFAMLSGGMLSIYNVGSFVNGGGADFAAPSGGYSSVASDGTNFFGLRNTGTTGWVFDVFSPGPGNSNTWTLAASNPVAIMTAPGTMRVSDGYMTLAGSDDSEEMFIYRLSGSYVPTRITINSFPLNPNGATNPNANDYFRNYHLQPPPGYTVPPPGYAHFAEGRVYKAANGKTYFILCAVGLGDVYELAAGDTITTTVNGTAGTPNPYAPAPAAGATFYGDPISFTGKTASQNIANIYWNFGNPEGGNLNSQQTSAPNQAITYQYSNLTKNGLGAKQVTASNVDGSVRGQATVTLATPAARFGILGTVPLKYLFTQPNASSPAPIVFADSFVDASDGSVESHYANWTLDGNLTHTLPGSSFGVGQCGAHSLVFTTNYGPYNAGTFTPISPIGAPVNNGAFVVGLDANSGAFNYTVRPFAADMQITATTASTITFSSTTRISNDAAIRAAIGVSMAYKWEVLTATGGPTAVPVGNATTYTINKPDLTPYPGAQVRLTVTSAPLNGTTCAGLETSTALSAPLVAPDPVLSQNGNCNGAPCTFSVASARGINTASDNWTYAWSVNGATGNNANVSASSWTGSTFTPTFQTTGTYTVKVTVTNAVGSASAQSNPISVTVNPCGPLTANSFVPVFSGNTSNCDMYTPCTTGETVTFTATFPLQGGYDPNCGTHTYAWTFPGGSCSGMSCSGIPTGSGTVTLTVTQPSGASRPYTTNINYGTITPPPPTNPCAGMTNRNVYTQVTAPSCPSGGTCATNDTLTFDLQGYLYGYGCFQSATWTFDGQVVAGSPIKTTHKYTADGAHTFSVAVRDTAGDPTVTVNGSVTTSSNISSCGTMSNSTVFVNITGGSCPTGGTCQNGDTLSFSVQGYNGFDINCANPAYDWDFGDGSGHSNVANPTHAYTASGPHNGSVKLTTGTQTFSRTFSVTTNTGGGGSCAPVQPNITLSINYSNAAGSCGPLAGPCGVGEVVDFSILVFGFYDFGCATHTYDWDFGDNSPHANTQAPTHQYAAGGTYHAKCIVNNGTPYTLTADVTISGSPGSVGVTPTIAITPMATVPNGFTFQASFDHPSLVKSWKWNFGDGTTRIVTGDSASNPKPLNYVYQDASKYTVTLTSYASADGSGSPNGTDNVPNEPTAPGKRRSVRH